MIDCNKFNQIRSIVESASKYDGPEGVLYELFESADSMDLMPADAILAMLLYAKRFYSDKLSDSASELSRALAAYEEFVKEDGNA